MCRILGILSTYGFSAEYLEEFRELADNGRVRRGASSGHKDGWGVVIYDKNKPRYLAREPSCASDDPKYLEVVESLHSMRGQGVMIAHLRKAGRNGGAATFENTHPFAEGRWVFAHNGGITRFNIKPRGLQGVTDSERFFRLLVNRFERGNDFEGALEWSVSFVRRKFDYSSLNFVLSDGHAIYGYRDCTKDEDYYSLLYRRGGKDVVFSQEPLGDGNWNSIPNGSIAIARKDLSVEIKSL